MTFSPCNRGFTEGRPQCTGIQREIINRSAYQPEPGRVPGETGDIPFATSGFLGMRIRKRGTAGRGQSGVHRTGCFLLTLPGS